MASTTLEDITPSVYTSGGWRALGRACQGRCVVSWHCYRNDPGGMLLPVQQRGYRMLLPGHSVEQTKVSSIHAGEKLLKGTIYWKLYILYIWKKTKIRNKQLYYDGYYNYYDKKLFHLFISALCAAVFLDSVNLTETFHVSLSLFQPHFSIECIYLWQLIRVLWWCISLSEEGNTWPTEGSRGSLSSCMLLYRESNCELSFTMQVIIQLPIRASLDHHFKCKKKKTTHATARPPGSSSPRICFGRISWRNVENAIWPVQHLKMNRFSNLTSS